LPIPEVLFSQSHQSLVSTESAFSLLTMFHRLATYGFLVNNCNKIFDVGNKLVPAHKRKGTYELVK
jgi:hypothetical protein